MYKLLSLALVMGTVGILCADTIGDPLHGYCAGAGQCLDNGTNSPTSTNPPSDFGFTVSPGPATGDLFVDILVPDNEQTGITSFVITGDLSGTATLFSATDWTSGMLDSYLGISASPANPIGAFLPSTQTFDASATGFSVYQASLGSVTLNGASNPNVFPLLNLGSDLPTGSYIVGFFDENGNEIATANSGAIFETGPPSSVPEPSYTLLLAGGILLVGIARMARAELRA
jgi:hypothetical protein